MYFQKKITKDTYLMKYFALTILFIFQISSAQATVPTSKIGAVKYLFTQLFVQRNRVSAFSFQKSVQPDATVLKGTLKSDMPNNTYIKLTLPKNSRVIDMDIAIDMKALKLNKFNNKAHFDISIQTLIRFTEERFAQKLFNQGLATRAQLEKMHFNFIKNSDDIFKFQIDFRNSGVNYPDAFAKYLLETLDEVNFSKFF